MFDSTKEDLRDILENAHTGALQLPDFQRDYVWEDSDVKSLIASVAKGFPVGALLTLETGGEVRFKPRPIQGVKAEGAEPRELLLDGQQRITSLYQSAFSTAPVMTKTSRGTLVERHYYIDMQKAVGGLANIEEAIVGVPADRIVRTDFGRKIELDLSSAEREYAEHMFPLDRAFDSKDWFFSWRDFWRAQGGDHYDLERKFDRDVLERIARYKMPVIRLEKGNSREAICLVFEKVNVGGKKLNAFELVTAIYAGDGFDLRADWLGAEGRRARLRAAGGRDGVFKNIEATEFLQACSLLHTREVRLARAAEGVEGKELPQISCQRDAMLALPLGAYQRYADAVEQGFIEAARFLNEQKIISQRDVPYPIQAVALASVFAVMGREAETQSAKQKLERWYWCGVLGELYGSSTETRIARDLTQLIAWLRGEAGEPRTVDEAWFQTARLDSLRIRLSAAYKGIHALLMRKGCRDFITGRPADLMTFWNDAIDIHHIFPQKWCKTHGKDRETYDSIVNKTPLFKRSNILISGDAPSIYLKRIEEAHGLAPEMLDEILRSHLIDPETLRNDDFDGFIEARRAALAGLISATMDKPLAEHALSPEPETEDRLRDEGQAEHDEDAVDAAQEDALSEAGRSRRAFWTHFVTRHPKTLINGGPGALVYRPRRIAAGVDLYLFIAQDHVGLYLRAPHGEPIETALSKLEPHAPALETTLGAPFRKDGADHLLVARADISPYDAATRDTAADWLAETADRYQRAVRDVLKLEAV